MGLPKDMLAGLLAESEGQDTVKKLEDEARVKFSTKELLEEIQAYTDAHPGLFPFALEITNRCIRACNNNLNKFYEVLKLTTPEIEGLLIRYVTIYLQCNLWLSTEIAKAGRSRESKEGEEAAEKAN